MELPRGEMEVQGASPQPVREWDDEHYFQDSGHEGDVDDVPWDVDVPEPSMAPASTESPAAAQPLSISPLTTAAELEHGAGTEVSRVPPEAFFQGMVVRHPEYGLGKIVALSGTRDRRTATVAFAAGAGERKFVLAKSRLCPAKSN